MTTDEARLLSMQVETSALTLLEMNEAQLTMLRNAIKQAAWTKVVIRCRDFSLGKDWLYVQFHSKGGTVIEAGISPEGVMHS